VLWAWALETIFNVEVQMIGDESALSPGRQLQLKRGRILKRLVEHLEAQELATKAGGRR
jgi:hypothetical protein